MKKLRWSPGLILSLLGALGVAVLVVVPFRAWIDQNHQRESLAAQAKSLADANQALDQKKTLLQSDAVIEQLARQQYQLVKPGEEAYAILPDSLPTAVAPVAEAAPAPHQSWVSRTWHWVTSRL